MDLQSPRPVTTVRRNPPRRAKQTPSINAPVPCTSSSFTAAAAVAGGITPFPLDELLQLDPQPAKKASSSNGPENLKVFLRVRPLEIRPKPAKNPKAKPRGKPQAPSPKGRKSKDSKACLVVNDSSSVTLSAPPSVFDSKRSKSELYEGFSFVFPPESSQEEIYERVMEPLLMDFMGGKSSLLAAMGPTGSGKTHTMFGSPREPGVVPFALRHIFNHAMGNAHDHQSRSYYLSMFEIYSERGKGERIFDLSPDGGDLSFQQSTIKGLQELRISDATQAEGLVARGLLKRATAATSANNQSSRSQCIINIRCALENVSDVDDLCAHNAVLTIADLAGAERERKTGNQGARLLESNFINNTSMVFGLCLRSLLEHQKNPKRSYEKHFKNSLLTRYLRDYLEGKKRMTLILTVKPGEDDYLDTSFLLRQASPFMKIKFHTVEDVPSAPRQKRNTTSYFRTEDHKRRKFNDADAGVVDHGKIDGDLPGEYQILEKEVNSEKLHETKAEQIPKMSSTSVKRLHADTKLNEELQVELARMKRNEEVMMKFSKALWSVLKQYKNMLEESEDKVKNLKENLGKEINQVAELKNELKELKSTCLCYKNPSSEGNLKPKVDAPFGHSASARQISSSDHVELKITDAELTSHLTPMPSCQNLEISSMDENECEALGLKGILFDEKTDVKSTFCSPVERCSFIVERQKISAYDAVHSSFTGGDLEVQCNKTTESPLEVEHVLEHLESTSNFIVKIPSDLHSQETADYVSSPSVLNYTTKDCSPVQKQILSKEDKKLKTSSASGPSSIIEDFNGPRDENILQECKSSIEQGHCSEILVEMESLRDMEMCGGSSTGVNCITGIEPSDNLTRSDQVEDSTSILSLSDRCSTLLVEKGEASDTSCSILSVEDEINHNNEEGSFQEFKHKPEDAEGIKDGQKESSHNESLTGRQLYPEVHPSNSHDVEEDVRGIIYKRESNLEEKKPVLDVSLVEDVKENDCCKVREHLKNGNDVSSNKVSTAEKPKRRLLPASALLLKDFSGLDMEAESTKERRTLPAVGRRTQGSMSLVRLLTAKQ